MGDEHKRGPVRVIDRRWLTEEGELRDGAPAPDAAAGATRPEQLESPAPATEAPVSPTYSLPPGLLAGLVDFLAQNAVALLTGQVAGLDRNPNAARLFIDLLEVVQRMTKDQISIQEARVLDDVLFQLRAMCVAPPSR